MMEGNREPKSQPLAVAPSPNGSREAKARDAYALALEALEQLFLEQRARISAEMEAAVATAEQSDFEDYASISRAAARAAQASWEADDQVAGLKKRLDDLYQERVVEPIMEIRRLSTKMEERNRSLFRRRVGDRR